MKLLLFDFGKDSKKRLNDFYAEVYRVEKEMATKKAWALSRNFLMKEWLLLGSDHLGLREAYPDCNLVEHGERIVCENVTMNGKCQNYSHGLFTEELMALLDHKFITHGGEVDMNHAIIYLLTKFINSADDENKVTFFQLPNNHTMMGLQHTYPFLYHHEEQKHHDFKVARGRDESTPLL